MKFSLQRVVNYNLGPEEMSSELLAVGNRGGVFVLLEGGRNSWREK